MDFVTADKIIGTLNKWVTEKQPIDHHLWLEAALKITLFLSEEKDKQYELEQEIAKRKVESKDSLPDMSMAEVNMRIEATDLYKEMRRQKGKVDQMLEFIKTAKRYATLTKEDFDNQKFQ